MDGRVHDFFFRGLAADELFHDPALAGDQDAVTQKKLFRPGLRNPVKDFGGRIQGRGHGDM